MTRPTIGEGDCSEDVTYLLTVLPVRYFDDAVDKAVVAYQRSRGLAADGIVGPATWAALEGDAPPYVPPGLPPAMEPNVQAHIEQIAANSTIANNDWDGRGMAPVGYTMGVACAFANAYRQFLIGYPPAVEMAKANTHNSDKDVMAWEAGRFNSAGMSNEKAGVDTLRHLWAYLLGLGMRESSGEHCCGRDQSASNTSADSCEAGAWQTSYDAHGCSPNWDMLFDAFNTGSESDNPQGFLDTFEQGVSCSNSEWDCYGSSTSNGYQHQKMSKSQPAYAAEVACITLRCLRQHYGPVIRREVEIEPAADAMLHEVQNYIDTVEETVAV